MESDAAAAEVTQDEHIMAALAHASVILPFWGLIGALVIWATQRDKSRFVAFQALQAVTYQLVLVVCGLLGFGCYMCSFFGIFLVVPVGIFASENAAASDTIAGWLAAITGLFPFCIMGIFTLLGLAYVIYGLYGAVRALQGHDFRYVIIGRRLEQYLSQGSSAA